jgi:serine/threonine-protein kinase
MIQFESPGFGDATWSMTPQARAKTLLNHVIENKYRLDSILGIGGMGAVFCATRLNLGDQVAIKILHPELMQDAQAAERFYREAQMAARVRHPNAISIHDVGVTRDSLQFIVMEMFDGQSLCQIIRQQSPLALKFISTVLSQVCAALDEAHKQGIVHRDIKPDNVLVLQTATEVRVKVLDFGIAKLRDHSSSSLTQTGSVMGTPHYMSPEQCMGDELDSRADIYSVGVMLYEMLCGAVPFDAPNPNAIAIQHVQKPPNSLIGNNNVTPKIQEVVFRSLAKNPNERQQTAGALAYELAMSVSNTLGTNTPHTPPTLVSVPLQEQSAYASPRSTPVVGADTNANQPTQVNRIDIASGNQPAFPFSKSGSQQTVSKKISLIPFAIVALALLMVIGVVGSFMLLSKKDNQNSRNENNEEKKPTPPDGMVYVRGGAFMMGGDEQQNVGFISPPHEVTVRPFFMDKYEVTCEEYKKFVDATGYLPPKGWVGNDYPPGTAKLPVTNVDWYAANEYARWAKKRLPTEEEWEFAARGTDGRLYVWGNEWKHGMANANNLNKGMVEVGTYKGASPFEIYDMIGNAWEWTASPLTAYPNGTMPNREPNKEYKIIRGGAFNSDKFAATTTRRGFYGAKGESYGYSNTSFRCAKDASSE